MMRLRYARNLPDVEDEPTKSEVLGVEVTWRRPIATKQQWDPEWESSSAPRSIGTPLGGQFLMYPVQWTTA